MAEWRLGRGWTEAELAERLNAAAAWSPNFSESEEDMDQDAGWRAVRSEARIGQEREGVPQSNGIYERARQAVAAFRFSDPRIVVGHFRPSQPLEGRNLLLELRVLGLRYLCGARVTAVREEADEQRTLFAWRYDTLAGHIEAGFEWFMLVKDHETGDIRFTIRARWRPGEFPNIWSRVGFHMLGPPRQERWHHRAHARLAALASQPQPTGRIRQRRGGLAHEGPEVVFARGAEAARSLL